MVQRVPEYTIPDVLDGILAENPGISFEDAQDALLADHTGEKGIEEVTRDDLKRLRAGFRTRLQEIPKWMRYHNAEHPVIEVEEIYQWLVDRLKPEYADKLSEETRLIGAEACLRHDDAHIGQLFRQLSGVETGTNISNEEMALLVAIAELGPEYAKPVLDLLSALMLPTAFGQNAGARPFEALDDGKKEQIRRGYKPEDMLQKLVRFADVAYFIKGWDHYKQRSIDLCHENGGPRSFDEWKAMNNGFLGFLNTLIDEVSEFLTDEAVAEIRGEWTDCKTALENIDAAEQADIQARLDYSPAEAAFVHLLDRLAGYHGQGNWSNHSELRGKATRLLEQFNAPKSICLNEGIDSILGTGRHLLTQAEINLLNHFRSA